MQPDAFIGAAVETPEVAQVFLGLPHYVISVCVGLCDAHTDDL